MAELDAFIAHNRSSRSREEMLAMLSRVEDLVWYSRYLANAGSDTPAAARENADRIQTEYGAILAQIDFDAPWQVCRLEGQQAALQWVLWPHDEELLPYGELYDS